MHYLLQAGYFVLLVGALVLVHELGHFAMAKACRVRVLRFSLGLGPRLFGRALGGTDYCLSAIPFGGFVKLLGEDPADEVPAADRGRAFHEKPLWQRALVVLAGPAANLLVPVVIYFALFAQVRALPPPVCGSVFPGQTAAGLLEPGDRVRAVDGEPVRSFADLEAAIAVRPGATVHLSVERGPRILEIAVPVGRRQVPALLGPREVGRIGVAPRSLAAEIGVPDPGSAAGRAGLRTFDRVTSVAAEPVETFAELEEKLGRIRGTPIRLTVLRGEPVDLGFADVVLLGPLSALLLPESGGAAGAAGAGLRPAELFAWRIEPDSPLARAGVRPGDELSTLDGAPLGSWEMLEEALAADPSREHTLGWRPAGSGAAARSARFRPAIRRGLDEYHQTRESLVHGAVPRPLWHLAPPVRVQRPVLLALARAFARAGAIIADMGRATFALVTGRIPRSSIGGPLLVLQIAGVAAERGWDYFLATLALVSINIGLVNLLPIPALDGGHLLFFAVEGLRRRPLSARARAAANTVGLVLVGALLVLAVRNDLVRTFFHG